MMFINACMYMVYKGIYAVYIGVHGCIVVSGVHQCTVVDIVQGYTWMYSRVQWRSQDFGNGVRVWSECLGY